MTLGDTHGRIRFLRDYIFPTAKALGVDQILQLGDYGYWEHEQDGVDFNDDVAALCELHGVEFCFLRGNHDNYGHLLEHYWSTDERGFIQVRPRLYFMPDGAVFNLGSVRFRVFGGAHSVDKGWRLDLERKRNRSEKHRHQGRAEAYLPEEPMRNHTGSIWFPDEEMDAADFERYLIEYDGPVDVVLSHERPRSVNVLRDLKDLPDCWRTQDMLQRALLTHKPRLWLHGHYHHNYVNSVRTGDNDKHATVFGLACDWDNAPRFVRPGDSWLLLDIDAEDGVPLKVIKSTAPRVEALLHPLDQDEADVAG